MKTLKCPLCGKEIVLQNNVYDEDFFTGRYTQMYYYECISCPLTATPVDTAKEAENQIKDLISRFPPIMRVWPGDKLQVEDGSVCEVMKVDKKLTTMDVRRGEGRPVFTIADTHVLRWPWQIEQKGGNE